MLADTRMRKLALTKIRYLRPPVGWLRRKSQSPTIDSDLTPSGSSLCSKGNSAARPVPPRRSPAFSRQQAAGNRQQAAGNRQQATVNKILNFIIVAAIAATILLLIYGCRQQAAGNRQQETPSEKNRLRPACQSDGPDKNANTRPDALSDRDFFMDEISELKILQLKNSNDLENPYPNASGYVLRAGRPETGTFEISTDCGVAQLAAREAHNLKVVGSNPAPAIPDEMSPTKGGGNADHLHSAADVEEIAWLIVWAVESDCGRNLARGDNGKAAGHAQFRRPRWDSVCRRMGAAWQWPQDCCDYEKARSVTIGAWRLERPEAISAGDVETLVRSHRLPADPGRKSNDEYWRKACAKAQLYASNHLFPCAAEARQDFQPGPADLSESDTATDGQTQGKPRPAIKEAWAAVATYLKRFQSESEADCGRGNDAIVETYKGRAPPCRTQNQAAGNRQQGAENNEDSIQRR